jgi:hypothetical protein
MYIITGSIGSGTTLVSQYLDTLGIYVLSEEDRHHPYYGSICEDSGYLDFFASLVRKFPYVEHFASRNAIVQKDDETLFRKLVQQSRRRQLWGFKTPYMLLFADWALSRLLLYTPAVTFIHVFRDLDHTVRSWERKIYKPETHEKTTQMVLSYHERALELYARWNTRINFYFVYIEDIVSHSYEFWKLLEVPLHYKPIDNILMSGKFHNEGLKRETERNIIYDVLWTNRWTP